MTTGTKVFRIIISVLLALCILSAAFFFFAVYYFDQIVIQQEDYGIFVAGISVTRENEDDILGDGTVFYDPDSRTLVFANAKIETEYSVLVSKIDLGICLLGENKFIASGDRYPVFISAADFYNAKDIYIYGDGSLTIEYLNPRTDSAVLQCDNLTLLSDITITTPDCTNLSNGIVCDSSLKMLNGATVTVNGSPAKSLMAFRVRGNAFLDVGTTINVTVEKGSTDAAKGVIVSGDLIIGEGASVNVSMAEDSAKVVECIRVTGLLEVGGDATVTASSAKSHAIESYGAIKFSEDAIVSATSEDGSADILCYGAVTDYGAAVSGEIKALGQCYDMFEKS